MARPQDPEKLAEWREKLARSKQSGQTVAAFCEAEGVSKSVYFWWQRKIAMLELKQKAAETKPSGAKTGEFMVIQLPNGVRFELPADNLDLVRAVVNELAGTMYETEPGPKSSPKKRPPRSSKRR